ncbi:MAG TPA: glycosyl transferase [Stellaceae bacterium]|nr:glycosyl transferase [Stellaceae bacterium]
MLAYHRRMGWAAAVAVAVLAATLVLTGAVRRWLGARAILDRPVERSSHSVPVPRGGGLAIIPVLLGGWGAIAAAGAPTRVLIVMAVAAALAALSWRDDIGGLPVPIRLLAHAAAVGVGLAALPGPIFQGALPIALDRAATWLMWLWFVELYNFMDGIDGITAVETIAIGTGVALAVTLAGATGDGTASLAVAAVAAALGFLRWNWHPAQIFLGDVGSVPLGYLIGWLLLLLAAKGLWAPALILPLYYLADASLTLLRRALSGERIWRAHRAHFYQRALAPDGDHAAVSCLVLAGDAALIAAALIAVRWPAPGLVLGVVVTAALLWRLEQRAHRA